MRLIDANALADRLYKLSSEYPEYETILRIIAGGLRHDRTFAPTIDAEPVVRCKDCKHWDFGDCYRQELTRPDDFCSYGERRSNETV